MLPAVNQLSALPHRSLPFPQDLCVVLILMLMLKQRKPNGLLVFNTVWPTVKPDALYLCVKNTNSAFTPKERVAPNFITQTQVTVHSNLFCNFRETEVKLCIYYEIRLKFTCAHKLRESVDSNRQTETMETSSYWQWSASFCSSQAIVVYWGSYTCSVPAHGHFY